jgi:hypothetical protein
MKKTIALFSTLLLLVTLASGEVRSIDIAIFGMD